MMRESIAREASLTRENRSVLRLLDKKLTIAIRQSQIPSDRMRRLASTERRR
jgi:hypothetical protein